MSQIRNKIISLGYVDKNAVEQQGNQLVGNVRSLQPQVEWSPFRRGEQHLKFKGTIPIHYKGNQYNIPVEIWLDYNFPNSGPVAYVTPTANMAVAQNNKYVDKSGRVYLQYLHQWNKNSRLTDLIVEMTSCFSMSPPVYSKPGQAAHSYQGQQSQPQYNQNAYNQYQNYQPQQQYQPQPPSYGGVAQPPQYNQVNNPQHREQLKVQVTSKMADILKKEFDSISAECRDMDKKQKKITMKKEQIDSALAQSENEIQQLQVRKQELEEENMKTLSWLESKEGATRIDVDNVVSAKTLTLSSCLKQLRKI